MIVPVIGGLLAALAGAALMVWGAIVRNAMEHDGTLDKAGRMPGGASLDAS
jgi:hypothetical protein